MNEYRENAMDRMTAVEEKLDTILKAVKEPKTIGENAFWLAFWGRMLPFVGVVAIACLVGGNSCNKSDNARLVEVARYQAETSKAEAARVQALESALHGAK